MLGYHGTSVRKAELIKNAKDTDHESIYEELKTDGHLGLGVYYFVDNNRVIAYSNAKEYPFSKDFYLEETAVIESDINKNNEYLCLDLDNERYKATFENVKSTIITATQNANKGYLIDDKTVDARTIKRMLMHMNNIGYVRKTFDKPTEFSDNVKSATCVCVVNTNCIDNTFIVKGR